MNVLSIPALRPYICASCWGRLSPKGKRTLSTSSDRKAASIYDVVAVGGGPVGLGFLAALKASPITNHLKTALLETQDLSKAALWDSGSDQFSNRAVSLTPSSVEFLNEIGAWKHVAHSRVQPYDEMKVWDGENDANMQFDWTTEAAKYNAPPRIVATMIENANLTRGLLNRISELGVGEESLVSNTTVSSIENGEDDPENINLSSWPIVSLSSTSSSPPLSEIAARLLVGADGVNSPVRNFAGISSNGWDYNRHGVVTTLHTAPKEDNDTFSSIFSESSTKVTAYQRFLPGIGGPIALLPLPGNRASLVWSTTPKHAGYLNSLGPESLLAMINAAFRLSMTDLAYMFTLAPQPDISSSTSPPQSSSHSDELAWRLQHTPLPTHLPPVVTEVQPNSLASFPLRFRHASTYISPRIALLGDAAHTIHPLAGQGLNLGLADAKALAETIAYAVEHGQDLGDILTLERYNRTRWGANAKVAGACDVLEKVYGVQGPFGGWVRGLGMKALESGLGKGLKGWVMRQAEG